MLALGEIRTCLLQHSGTAARSVVSELLRLTPGERVRVSERPLAYAVSPELITGVDCRMPTATGARVRGVGTVAARGVVTGGRVLQGSVYARLERGALGRRMPWSHYLARPGVVETTGRFDRDDVFRGFLADRTAESTLDLGALSDRLIGKVQLRPQLDHAAPFKSRRTWLRWAATTADRNGSRVGGEFTVGGDNLRTFSLVLDDAALSAVVELCEDLALHDWVLTTLLQIVERSSLGSGDGSQELEGLRPAIDHLLHLWMPGARVAPELLPLWDSLERSPGFTRQWQANVSRIRDQLAVQVLGTLNRQFPESKGGARVRSR